MKVVDIAVWSLAIIVGIIAYLCVALAAFVIWPPAAEIMLVLLVAPFFTPETYMLIAHFWRKRRTAGRPQSVGTLGKAD
jgi:hypothetical protein